MRQKGTVTVFFSLIFMILFSFILSFFEMAAYTARSSYHASAARLAVENYFAAYLNPLYEEYHIFGREVPSGEGMLSYSEQRIAEDVAYMTVKREGERSLLLRSGAEFGAVSASELTDNELEGFYSQAITAMKYRAVPEFLTTLAELSGMTEQADAHLEIAGAKAAADSAYAKVDEKILHLIQLVDGVDIGKYEKFLGGKNVFFQKDVYVKYFCIDPEGAADYFDRTQVYQAFLENHENPYGFLDNLCKGLEDLTDEIEKREKREAECAERLEKIEEASEDISTKEAELKETMEGASLYYAEILVKLGKLILEKGDKEDIEKLTKQASEVKDGLDKMSTQQEAYETQAKQLKEEKESLEEEQKELKEKKKEQEKSLKDLIKSEKNFVKQCKKVRDICGEAYDYVGELQEELVKAKKVKDTCESILDMLQFVIDEESEQAYREELDMYLFYEDLDGYDFNKMKQTLLGNQSSLWNITEQIQETDVKSLREAVNGLKAEKEAVSTYSFHGLKLDYGEMSLADSLYDEVDSMISKQVAEGFLGFLTEKELSEKELDASYLPSGFRYEEESFDIFSLLGTDMSGIFSELQNLLPKELSADSIVNEASDTILFHSYLATHFGNFLDENKNGALSYEKEYLIAGNASDKENLSSVAMRICAIRTILHFVSLYTDSTRKAPVEQAALAACGIIGLPALKSIVVFLILFVWALEEAIIDTAAFLQGKRLLLYPGKNGGNLTFQEVLMFSKTFVLQKAKQRKDDKGIAFGYNEFLQLFIFLTPKEDKKYRAADLIQENLRKSYQESFRLNRCVWALSYRTDDKIYEYAYE